MITCMFGAVCECVVWLSRFSLKCEQFILDMELIIVPSDHFPQDAAATVPTMEAASVDGTIQRAGGWG